jgi:AcrR family transcriptional regulator
MAAPVLAGHAAGRRRRLPRDERVAQLLDVAQSLFADRGYAATSIDLIARTAGVSRPVVYDHFGSKDGIYFACVRRARGEFHTAIIAGIVGVDGLAERLYAGLDACFAFIESDPDRWAVMFRGVALTGEAADEAVRLRFETVGMLAAMIQDAVPDAPPHRVEAFAHALSGAGEQMERWWRARPEMTREEVVDHLHRFAWFGISQLAPGEEAA